MTSIETRELRIGERSLAPGEPVAIRSPWSGEVVGRVHLAGPGELDAAAAESVRAFRAWRAAPAWRRAGVLGDLSRALTAQAEDVARTLALEAAKPIADARAEVARAAHTFALAEGEALRLTGEYLPLDLAPGNEGRSAIVKRVPAGPVLGITPFNFPLNLVAHKVAPALACGCSIVVKPAPQTPLTAHRLADLARAAGLPEGVLIVLPTTNELAPRLVEDERFATLSFTGSPAVGWALKARAGKKRVLLELGGNAAVIVHDDAEFERALERSLVGAFSYSGQVCISVQRIYAARSLHGRFRDALVARARALPVGDPLDPATRVSALVRAAEADRILAWTREAVAGGARVLTGGEAVAGPGGRAVAPTVLEGTRPDQRVIAEEVFGPLVAVEPYDDLEAAFDAVNAGRFGLQAGVFTRELGVAQRAFERLEVGAVLVNEVPTWRADAMPYGGVKDSGFGREGVRYAIEEMTERRALVLPPP